MALTKANFRTVIRQILDDPNGRWWNDTNLDLLTGIVYDDRWAELLAFVPRYVSQLDELTSLTSPGYVRLNKTTDTPAGDLSQRFFRVQSIVRDNQEYSPIDPRWIVVQDNVVQAVAGGSSYRYFQQGRFVYLFPLDTAADVEFRYSFLPATYGGLGSGDLISWPDGQEMALIYEVSSRAFMKGGRDMDLSRALRAAGNDAMRDCVAAVERIHAGPVVMTPADMPQAWGSA